MRHWKTHDHGLTVIGLVRQLLVTNQHFGNTATLDDKTGGYCKLRGLLTLNRSFSLIFRPTHILHVICTANAMADVPDQHDGGINKREKCINFCRSLYNRIADVQPSITEEADVVKVWHDRAKCTRFSLLSPFVTALLFVADVAMDCEIAATHYSRGDYRWAAYTLTVIVFSLIITDVLSAIFFLDDRKDEDKAEQLRENDLEVKPWFYAFHFIFCGRLIR